MKTSTVKWFVEWFGRKYAAVPYDRVHLFKALTYFRDGAFEANVTARNSPDSDYFLGA